MSTTAKLAKASIDFSTNAKIVRVGSIESDGRYDLRAGAAGKGRKLASCRFMASANTTSSDHAYSTCRQAAKAAGLRLADDVILDVADALRAAGLNDMLAERVVEAEAKGCLLWTANRLTTTDSSKLDMAVRS